MESWIKRHAFVFGILTIVLLMLFLSCGAHRKSKKSISRDCGNEHNGLHFSIQPAEEQYELGKPIFVDLQIRNDGHCLWHLPGFNDDYGFYTWRAETPDGKPLTRNRLMVNTGDNVPGQPVWHPKIPIETFSIAPGETMRTRVRANFPFMGVNRPEKWTGDVFLFVSYNPEKLKLIANEGVYPFPIEGRGVIPFKERTKPEKINECNETDKPALRMSLSTEWRGDESQELFLLVGIENTGDCTACLPNVETGQRHGCRTYVDGSHQCSRKIYSWKLYPFIEPFHLPTDPNPRDSYPLDIVCIAPGETHRETIPALPPDIEMPQRGFSQFFPLEYWEKDILSGRASWIELTYHGVYFYKTISGHFIIQTPMKAKADVRMP